MVGRRKSAATTVLFSLSHSYRHLTHSSLRINELLSFAASAYYFTLLLLFVSINLFKLNRFFRHFSSKPIVIISLFLFLLCPCRNLRNPPKFTRINPSRPTANFSFFFYPITPICDTGRFIPTTSFYPPRFRHASAKAHCRDRMSALGQKSLRWPPDFLGLLSIPSILPRFIGHEESGATTALLFPFYLFRCMVPRGKALLRWPQ